MRHPGASTLLSSFLNIGPNARDAQHILSHTGLQHAAQAEVVSTVFQVFHGLGTRVGTVRGWCTESDQAEEAYRAEAQSPRTLGCDVGAALQVRIGRCDRGNRGACGALGAMAWAAAVRLCRAAESSSSDPLTRHAPPATREFARGARRRHAPVVSDYRPAGCGGQSGSPGKTRVLLSVRSQCVPLTQVGHPGRRAPWWRALL